MDPDAGVTDLHNGQLGVARVSALLTPRTVRHTLRQLVNVKGD